MKTLLVWSLVLWFALITEHAHPAQLPSGSLLLPLAVSCMFWRRRADGIVLATLFLMLRWVLHTSGPPLEIFAVLMTAAILLTTRPRPDVLHRSRSHLRRLHPLLVCCCGALALSFGAAFSHGLTDGSLSVELLTQGLHLSGHQLAIALPVAAAVAMCAWLLEELGVHRPLPV